MGIWNWWWCELMTHNMEWILTLSYTMFLERPLCVSDILSRYCIGIGKRLSYRKTKNGGWFLFF